MENKNIELKKKKQELDEKMLKTLDTMMDDLTKPKTNFEIQCIYNRLIVLETKLAMIEKVLF